MKLMPSRAYLTYGMSAGKRDQIDKKFFFEIINVLDQMIKSTSILLKNFFLKKISIWSLFPALTPYTEHPENLVPVIDDLTLKKEFIILDFRRSKDDPLSIRVRWDTSLRSILDQSHTILDQSQKQSSINPDSVNNTFGSSNGLDKFSPYGQKAIVEAKKNGTLVDFARNMPTPKE